VTVAKKKSPKKSPAKKAPAASAREAYPSKAAEVDAFLAELVHPKRDVLVELRRVVLAASPDIGEELKWRSPTFFYAGPMPKTDPKKYLRYLLNVNIFRRDALRLVFMHAGEVDDPESILEGDYEDGRRLVTLASAADLRAKRRAITGVLRALVRAVPR
jgi:hypothetical protein